METATDNQFDVDKCVNEDGRKCEFDVNNDGDWREAYYIGPDVSVARSVIRSPHIGHSRPDSIETCRIRNIQPKPRTQAIAVMENKDGERYAYVPLIKAGHSRKVGEVTIDLDKCEQVQPDGVMTPDELGKRGIAILPCLGNGGTFRIARTTTGIGWNQGWRDGAWVSGRPHWFPTFRAAQIEATRIIKEGLHHA